MTRPERRLPAAFAGVLLLLATACTTADRQEPSAPTAIPADDNLNATLWVQTSSEYVAAALQAYRLAGSMLERGLADPGWTASLEQQQAGEFAELPPAVILDVDETVLDNSGYQARLILDGAEFATASWQSWVREEKAVPVPGALDFVRAADAAGVTVFYVTNRNHEVEEATRENLVRLGFPVSDDPDTLLTREERPDWGSDKGSRRAIVAAGYRVLLLIGDNYGDFASDVNVSVSERRARTESQRDLWGSRWIVLPNPEYGSWDGALIDFRYSLPAGERRRIKRRALDPVR